MLQKFLDISKRLHGHLIARDKNGAGYTYIEQPALRRAIRLYKTIQSVVLREWVSRNIEIDQKLDFKAISEDLAQKAKDNLGINPLDSTFIKANHERIIHIAKHAQSHTISDIFRKVAYTAWCNMRWEKAKKQGDFGIVSTAFAHSVRLSHTIAGHKAKLLGLNTPYEAIIDEFIPEIDLEAIKPELQRILDYCDEQKAWMQNHPGLPSIESTGQNPKWTMDIDTQMKICRKLAETMGFDFDHGHLERGMHPLGVGSRGDTLLSVNPREKDCFIAFMDMIHEVGHGLYRQNLPEDWHIHPVGHVASQAMDEAIALLMENCIARSDAGASFIYRSIQEVIGGDPAFSMKDLQDRLNGYGPTKFRANANELEYPLHLDIRNTILLDIYEGRLDPKDLPERWNKDIARVIRLEVHNDRDGCLQDIHWFAMQFGYFRNYQIGFAMSYQIFDAMQDDMPDMLEKIGQSSDFSSARAWLEENIFRWGAKHNTMTLLKNATGRDFSADSYINLMEERYFPIFPHLNKASKPQDLPAISAE